MRTSASLIATLPGVEDYAWLPSGKLMMAKDAKLFVVPSPERQLESGRGFHGSGIVRNFAADALQAKGDRLPAIVVRHSHRQIAKPMLEQRGKSNRRCLSTHDAAAHGYDLPARIASLINLVVCPAAFGAHQRGNLFRRSRVSSTAVSWRCRVPQTSGATLPNAKARNEFIKRDREFR